jgi:hypothetical protein
MKHELEPSWTSEQRATAERHREAWEQFFATERRGAAEDPSLGAAEQPRIAAVVAQHARELMRYPHVVGVAPGFCTRGGRPVDEQCLVVYVDRKLPESELGTDELLPTEIAGVPVDVVEVGRLEPLQR